jgi:transcriptional regulator with XRE-family HTH domain
LRWDLGELYTAVDEQRRKRGLTWTALADLLECTHSRLTNLRAARQADLALVMRLTQWLHRPAAAFIHPTRW